MLSLLKSRRNKLVAVLAVLVAGIVGYMLYSANLDRTGFVGVLSNELVAIGGETDGWCLMPDDHSVAPIELDVRNVLVEAGKLNGKRVRIWGANATKRTLERGDHTVLVVQRLAQRN